MMTIGYGWTMVAAAVDVNWDLAKPDTKARSSKASKSV